MLIDAGQELTRACAVPSPTARKFDATPENIEKRVKRFTLPNGLKVALFPKKSRGETIVGTLTLHFGNEDSLNGRTTAAGYVGSMMMRGTKNPHARQQDSGATRWTQVLALGSAPAGRFAEPRADSEDQTASNNIWVS